MAEGAAPITRRAGPWPCDGARHEPTEDELQPCTWVMWQRGRTVTADAYLMAVMDLQAFSRVVAGFFTSYDVWLTPTLAAPATACRRDSLHLRRPMAARPGRRPFVAFPAVFANITGGLAMSVPLHWRRPGCRSARAYSRPDR